MNKSLYLTDDQYMAALKRNRDAIADGDPFEAVDSEETGNKFTEASWGLCNQKPGFWPEDTWMFPQTHGRDERPKYRGHGQRCPMDMREAGSPLGCFYSCAIFKGRIRATDRATALAAYDAEIERAAQKARP